MTQRQANALLAERNRLLDAWRTAENSSKMQILVRIDDIDERLRTIQQKPVMREVRTRRFIRK